MWQKVVDRARYLLKHKEQTEKNTTDIKDQQQALDTMATFVQRLAFEFERLRDNEMHEREKMALCLENMLLRSERALPPANASESVTLAALQAQIEAWQQEVEALKKRVEELERR